ncbi:MAG TPA: SEC-C metal-binding domain-containing protein [Armatimonadota bacterium]|jgi:preprotein translocase subunit SecA|nr:SEC-C metal-binding domain-containing protein [Armatimonadota bacterium]HPO73813.1 SEC-C metal-binding domain-containing protein [Armatimonadota bacterium]HPT98560.1 SEC-C metal-binding domain-containing protein [Armatimonadota bacterium]
MSILTHITKLMFDGNEREVRRLQGIVDQVNALEPELLALSDDEIRARGPMFRERIQESLAKRLTPEEREQQGPEYVAALQDVLTDMLPEVFATVREASRRTLGEGRPPTDPRAMRHFDVQIMGGVVLHQGRIAEMKTGEGKTLVATLPVCLNALSGDGVHVATVNDYLAKRDARWNGPIYHMLGLSVAVIQSVPHESAYLYDPEYVSDDPTMHQLRPITRREAYLADITYGTHAEFGFDYLRDNLEFDEQRLRQRPLNFAIVDEVDSILVDEARTPLIISGFAEESTELYTRVDRVVRSLTAERDYTVDEKQRTATLTDEGVARVERGLGIQNIADDMRVLGIVNASLKAHYVFRKDIDYVVYQHKDESGRRGEQEIVIVDENTGRLMFGRRYSEGLHQAIEAKENVRVQHESQTIATITYQNYFRMYRKLAGMTGTAKTEEGEFRKIYNLDVVQIPTNRPMIRIDHPDVVYKTEEAKFRGCVADILQCFCRKQPVLVGTRTIEVSERLADRLSADNLQLMAMIWLLRDRVYGDKALSKEEKAEKHAFLNRKILYSADRARLTPEERRERFESVRDLWPMAKELGVSTDVLSEENVDRLAAILEVQNKRRLQMALTYGIPHSVLNAKYHEKEAQIIAEAGRAGAVTIATNMAGRGVDIILGGTPDPNADGSGRLLPTDIRDMTALAKKLHAARDPLTRYLQGRLSAETRQLMEIDLYEGAMAASEKLEAALVEELNRVILGPSIYDPQRFQHLMLSDEAREMVAHDGPLSPEQTAWLNRRLLESAFPREIARAYSPAEAALVREVGGLHILGTERHEARRIDNQLRGRAGRQGDPGSSRFYLSLEDELWRLFGDRGHALLGSWPEEEPVEAKLLTKAIARAQKKVEERNFGIREHTLKYDDVMNEQRRVIYEQRRRILLGGRVWNGVHYPPVDLRANIMESAQELIVDAVNTHCPPEVAPNEWDIPGLYRSLHDIFEVSRFLHESDLYGKEPNELIELLVQTAERVYAEREQVFTPEIVRELERNIFLHVVNEKWVAHLDAMDYLREGIHLRAYAQVDPLVAYTKEAYEMWQALQADIRQDVVRWAFYARPAVQVVQQPKYQMVESGSTDVADEPQSKTIRKKNGKIGRNDPCPCGSGKKYKHCCLGKN